MIIICIENIEKRNIKKDNCKSFVKRYQCNNIVAKDVIIWSVHLHWDKLTKTEVHAT